VKGLFDIPQKDIVLYCIPVRSRITLVMISYFTKNHIWVEMREKPPRLDGRSCHG